MRPVFERGLDRRGSVALSQGMAMAGSLLQPAAIMAAGPAAAATPPAASSASASLLLHLLLPTAPMTLTPLYSKRLSDVPLAHALAMPGHWQAGVVRGSGGAHGLGGAAASPPQTGYLTMDQARSVLPLLADDANVGACRAGICNGPMLPALLPEASMRCEHVFYNL